MLLIIDLIPDRIIEWGAFYERNKDDTEWNTDLDLDVIVFGIEALSPLEGADEEEISSRVLDIFQGKPLTH